MSLSTQPPLNYSNSGPAIVISGTVVGFVTTVTEFGLDDWLCLAALLFQHAVMASSAATLVGEIAYTFSSSLIKLSVLAFYRRIFPTRVVKVGTRIIATACIAWFIPIIILDFSQCVPLKAVWLVELQDLPTTKCIDQFQFFFSQSIVNSIIDFSALSLPIREVFKLQTTTRLKINIGLVFLLGGIAFAASLVRTISAGQILQQGITNFSKQFITPVLATVGEIYVAIIGACLPTLGPIYRKLRYGNPLSTHTTAVSEGIPASGKNSNPGNRTADWKHYGDRNDSFERLHETDDALTPTRQNGNHRVKISSSGIDSGTTFSNSWSYPLDGVMITQDTLWTETDSRSHHRAT
ncbi:hypothetical protein F4678DRAFT_484896 [Xylaria arbuscula]|nr:hypothetical protein F4678DRAFT_484896 [Xylaria arbuscula]